MAAFAKRIFALLYGNELGKELELIEMAVIWITGATMKNK
tara:strand:+ start:2364 stop:2483 length:120 start_codon:yes stop_codon:yes gene_type:complete